MNSIFRKEVAELLPAVALLALGGAALAFVPKSETHLVPSLAFAHGALGAATGAWQAWLDRRAVGDAFLLHRPVPRWRIHAARSLAGLAAAVAVSCVSLGVTLFVPLGRGLETFGTLLDPKSFPQWGDLSTGVCAFAALFAVAGWAAVRAGASAPGIVRSLRDGVVVPFVALLAVGATRSDAAAAGIAAGVALTATLLVVARQTAYSGGAR